jgi:hypothetical protein
MLMQRCCVRSCGACGLGCSAKYEGAPTHDHAEFRSDAERDHVLGHLLAEANASVELLRHDVPQRRVNRQFHPHVWVDRRELRQRRPQDRLGRMAGCCDPDGS